MASNPVAASTSAGYAFLCQAGSGTRRNILLRRARILSHVSWERLHGPSVTSTARPAKPREISPANARGHLGW